MTGQPHGYQCVEYSLESHVCEHERGRDRRRFTSILCSHAKYGRSRQLGVWWNLVEADSVPSGTAGPISLIINRAR